MPRKRMIDPDIWTDSKLAKASRDERLLFIGIFGNADDEGRIMASPAYLKSIIFPYDDDITASDVKKMRDHLAELNPNIILYENAGDEYIQLKRWERYQKPRYPKPSKIPPPSHFTQKDESLPQACNQKAESLQPSIDQVSIGKVKTSAATMVETPPHEKTIYQSLSRLRGWRADEGEDLPWVRDFISEFPGFGAADVKACGDYHSGRAPPKHKGIWKNRLRNWMIKKHDFEAQRSDSGQRGRRRVEPRTKTKDFEGKW